MPVLRRVLAAATLTALAVGCGVALQDPDPGAVAEDDPSTPLASFDTSAVTVLRTAFCDRVPADAVEEALGAEPEDATEYGNGDRVRLARGVRDVAHEYGCSWTADGVTASAWVYAPPVPRSTAAKWVRRARADKGCDQVPGAPPYGAPSVGLVCTGGRFQQVSFRGLFGDAWLTCSIRSSRVSAGQSLDEAVDRTGRWCVAVARAAGSDGA